MLDVTLAMARSLTVRALGPTHFLTSGFFRFGISLPCITPCGYIGIARTRATNGAEYPRRMSRGGRFLEDFLIRSDGRLAPAAAEDSALTAMNPVETIRVDPEFRLSQLLGSPTSRSVCRPLLSR